MACGRKEKIIDKPFMAVGYGSRGGHHCGDLCTALNKTDLMAV